MKVEGVKIGDCCDKKVETLRSYKGLIDYIDISSIDNIQKSITAFQTIDSELAPSRAKQLVKKNDVLVSTVRPNLNAVALIDIESDNILVASTGYCVLRCNQRLNCRYLYYFCQSARFIDCLVNQATGASYPAVNSSIVRNCIIPLPSIEDQQRIAMLLDKLSTLISLRKQQLEKLDELVKSRFVEMFGTAQMEVAVVDVCTEIVDCPHSTPKYEGQLIHPAIRTTEIKNGYIDWDTMKYVSREEYAKRISRLEPKPGDIVYGREGTYGNACILPNGYEFCLGQRVMLFRADESKVLPEYLLYALLSDSVKRQADEKNIGATVPHVNVADAKQFQIKLPALEGQRIFSDLVAEINKTKSTFQRSLDNLEMLKNALMQKYFG